MRILLLDLDTLRPDHLGCYGYARDTSPNLDAIAREAMRFTNYHCADAPCLPSRAALQTGRFGFHNGVVGHGGLPADLRPMGLARGFKDQMLTGGLFYQFRLAGMHTASFNSFAERHSAYWFDAGFNEIYNAGKSGGEIAEEVVEPALGWLDRRGEKDNWFLHINLWDAHTPYRAPMELGNPFADDPLPEWFTPETLALHRKHVGPHCINEIMMYHDRAPAQFPRQLGKAETMEELKQVVDGYDCGIRYMDGQIGRILEKLRALGVYDDTAILVTSDHGENIGELGLYSEHATADEITTRVPMLIKWPGMKTGVAEGLRYNLDLAPTVADLLGLERNPKWDGESYASLLRGGEDNGREYLVVSQCAHVCQRSVRFGDCIYIRTYHDGYHLFDEEMLFDIRRDFHEQHNLAAERPDLCAQACRYLTDWQEKMILTGDSDVDPMATVLREGGPYHAKEGSLADYCRRLEQTGRAEGAAILRRKYRVGE